MTVATAVAHPNIALVKYWGKRDVALNLPAVPSLSLTLAGYRTRTTVRWGAPADDLVFGGVRAEDPKVFRFLDLLAPGRPPCAVDTDNDFPTGAGLASSASAFAALAVAGAAAAGLSLTPDALSALARRGSGSACRSLYGGFVEWRKGARADGEDSVAVQVADEHHWDLRLVVAVVSASRKETGSTEGMERSRATSPYWDTWVGLGAGHVDEARAAVLARDLPRLGRVMETSTLAMHATMHTAWPPLVYWQPATVAALHAVFGLRRDGVAAFATMDAGPQVKVLCAPGDVPQVTAALAPHALRVDVHRPGGPVRVWAGEGPA